jgi:hypothetical protein
MRRHNPRRRGGPGKAPVAVGTAAAGAMLTPRLPPVILRIQVSGKVGSGHIAARPPRRTFCNGFGGAQILWPCPTLDHGTNPLGFAVYAATTVTHSRRYRDNGRSRTPGWAGCLM